MKKAIILIFFCGAVCYALVWAEAQPESRQHISSTELINNAKEYDGKGVVYVGEAVGDVMVRGDFEWVNINDGENAIGIWLNKELAGEIQFTGSYRAKGDRLEITGVFHRSCIQHGGDMDIHAQEIRKISPGKLVKEELDTVKRNLTFVLLGILCLALIFVRLWRSKTAIS